jgi:CheY-like chemotaxis protein
MPGPILIVDDDDVTRDTLSLLFRGAGYAVVTAADGKQALSYLHTLPVPGLVLLDLLMPVANGWQFLGERSKDPAWAAVPVVVLSGGGKRLRNAALALGADEFFEKPMDPDDLLAVVAHYV